MPLAGAIADRVRGLIPVTWDALLNDRRVGGAPLQGAIDLAKEVVTGAVVDPLTEVNYPLLVIDYIAKNAVIQIIPAGIDYWMNQAMNVTSTGTNESLTYKDRASQLDALKNEFVNEVRVKQMEVSKLIGFYIDNGKAVPQLSSASINPFHLTPSPEEFPRPYKQTQYS